MTTRLIASLGMLVCLFAAGCGASLSALETAHDATDWIPARLSIDPHSFDNGGSINSVQAIEHDLGNELVLELQVSGARDLHGLYVEVDYDPAVFTPQGVDKGALLGAAEEVLLLSVLDQPGRAAIGLLQIHPESHPAANGKGSLASLHLLKQPFGASHAASQVPGGPSGKAQLKYTPAIFPGDPAYLDWYYTSRGDYNQDGLVAISDLTPLGIHFGEHGGFATELEQSQIDGDANGELGIADLTPIAANLGSQLSAYRVYRSGSQADYPAAGASGNGNAVLVETLSFADMQRQAGERGHFMLAIPAVQSQAYYWVRPTDGSSEGFASNLASVQPGQLKPSVQLQADQYSGDAPLSLNLSAVADDADGSIVKYDWDLDGDGSFETNTGLLSQASVTLSQPGSLKLAVRVTDNDGLSADDSVQISVSQNGNLPPLVQFAALRSAGDYPYDCALNFSGSSDPDGTIASYELDIDGGGSPEQVFPGDATGSPLVLPIGDYQLTLTAVDNEGLRSSAQLAVSVGLREWIQRQAYASPALVNCGELKLSSTKVGVFPGIFSPRMMIAASYKTSFDGYDLGVIRAADRDGSSWNAPAIVSHADSTLIAGVDMYVHLATPLLSYIAKTGGQSPGYPYFRSARSVTGTSWNFPAILDGNGVGAAMQIGEFGGLPLACYRLPQSGNALVLRSDTDPLGKSGWPQSRSIFPGASDYLFVMAHDASHAGVAIMQQSDGTMDLYYSGPAGSSLQDWPQQPNLVRPDAPATTIRPSLAFVAGRPMLAWVDVPSREIRLSVASDASGQAWEEHTVGPIQASAGNTDVLSLLDCNGVPAIFHLHAYSNERRLMFNAALDPLGEHWLAPEPVTDNADWHLSAAMFEGSPVCAYWTGNCSSLRVASSLPPGGLN